MYLSSGGTRGHIVDVSSLGGHALTTHCLIKVVGRKSGKTYVRPLIYGNVGGEVVFDGTRIGPGVPNYVKLANIWIIVNIGGGPTPDKPDIILDVQVKLGIQSGPVPARREGPLHAQNPEHPIVMELHLVALLAQEHQGRMAGPRGEDHVIVRGRPKRTHHYVIRTTFPQDVWYDEDRQLVKVELKGSDGSIIRYQPG